VDHGDIQECGTVGRGKGHINVGPSPLMANSCNAIRCVTVIRKRSTPCTGGDVAESYLSVVMLKRAAPTQAIVTHGVVYIAALDVTPTRKRVGGDKSWKYWNGPQLGEVCG
jgi:hypothetical protein